MFKKEFIQFWNKKHERYPSDVVFQQQIDLLSTRLMPLLSELSPWRKNLEEFEKEVFKWSNHSDILFVADFPGLHLENYVSTDYTNITFKIIQGTVALEQFNLSHSGVLNITLFKGDSVKIKEGTFHKVYTISNETSCYMYTYNNYNYKKLNNIGDSF